MTQTHTRGMPLQPRRGLIGTVFVDKFRAFLPFHMAWGLAGTATLLNLIPWAQQNPASVVGGMTLIAALCVLGVRMGNIRYVENQTFGFLVIGACWLWLLIVYLADPDTGTAGFSLAILVIVFGLVYAVDRRNNAKIAVAEKTRSWARDENRQARAKVDTTWWIEHNQTEFGWEGVLAWAGSSNLVDEIINNRVRLEAEWGERENTLTIEREPDSRGTYYTDRVRCRCVQTNPLSASIEWDGVIADSITSSKRIATFADAKHVEMSLWEPEVGGFHMLFAGATRSGKSVAMKHQIATWGAARDGSVIVTLCDLKGGTSFLKFAPMAAWTVTTIEDAVIQLQALALITQARGAYIASRPDWEETWRPGPGFPVILAFFDEISQLLDKDVPAAIKSPAIAAMKTIARMGAGVGVLLRLGVQDPTTESIGSMQILTQLGWRVAFRLQYFDRGKYCVPALAKKGAEPANISRSNRGECYIEDGEMNRIERARWVYMTSSQENRIIKESARHQRTFAQCDYAQVGSESARPMLEARRIFTIEDIPPGSDEDEDAPVQIGGHTISPPTRQLDPAVRPVGEAYPVDDDGEPVDAPSRPTLETVQGGRVETASEQVNPEDADAYAMRLATRGASPGFRRTIVEALMAERPEGLSVDYLRAKCQEVHQTRPSRTFVNDRLTEWREFDPPLVAHLGRGKGYAWVYTGMAEPVEGDEAEAAQDQPEVRPRWLHPVKDEEDE